MLEELFKLLNAAQIESDNDKKLSLYEEYSDKLAKLLNNKEEISKYSKSELEKLKQIHTSIQEEITTAFKSFKKDIKNFQDIKNGINAYNNMLKGVTTRNLKKG